MNHIGLGTRQLTGTECYTTVAKALELGYRHIDTAEIYDNSTVIGQAIHDSNISREELRLTSKLWIADYGSVSQTIHQMLEELQTDYLDLLLLHRPTTLSEHEEVFGILLQLKQKGHIRHIGISNFSYSQFDHAVQYLGSELYAAQYEYHICLDQSTILDKCRQHNIIFEAYSPLAHGKLRNDKQTIIVLEQIAKKHSLTQSQVMLSWLLDQHITILPKSTSREHLQENLSAPTGILDDEDRHRIAGFPKHFRYCNPVQIAPEWEK